jgi:hypothetical protein
MQNQFDKYSTATIQTLDTQYDYQSIMHYDPVAFSRNGQPTIVPKVNTQIGQRGGFSQLDAYKINRLYECTASGSTTIVSPHVITINLGTTTPLPTPSQKCVDKRPDCAQLASQGKAII